MLQKSLFVLFLVVLSCATLGKAQAEPTIVPAGEPDPANMSTQPNADFVDIFTRQLAYANEAKKFHGQLIERQKNYGDANVKLERQYRVSKNKYYGYDEKPEESDAESTESFGPPVSP